MHIFSRWCLGGVPTYFAMSFYPIIPNYKKGPLFFLVKGCIIRTFNFCNIFKTEQEKVKKHYRMKLWSL